MSTVDS